MSLQLGVNNSFYNSKVGSSKQSEIILARVNKIILGPMEGVNQPDKDFEANGQWASVGAILFTVMYGSELVSSTTSTVAYPYNSNIRQYPLKGEIVELVYGPSTGLNESRLEKTLYYKNPVNIWNSVHHNAFPNFLDLADYSNNLSIPYQTTTNGIVSTEVTDTKTFPLGKTFVERSDIRNLQAFEGDLLYEGRWGQSIRFGSTVLNSPTKNPWSSTGSNGDPILIIRNGQAVSKGTDNWITATEDINSDAASIYLCSGQSIIIQDLLNFKLDSFTIGTKLTEDNTQLRKTQPILTDTISPISQSQFELRYAQTSTQTNNPNSNTDKIVGS